MKDENKISWAMYGPDVISENRMKQITEETHPDHEIVSIKVEDDRDIGLGYKASWVSKEKKTQRN